MVSVWSRPFCRKRSLHDPFGFAQDRLIPAYDARAEKKNRDQRRAREQRLQWGHHHTKPEVVVAVDGNEVAAGGAADVVLIEVERAAAQHPVTQGI